MERKLGSPICVNQNRFAIDNSIPANLFGIKIKGTTASAGVVDDSGEEEILNH